MLSSNISDITYMLFGYRLDTSQGDCHAILKSFSRNPVHDQLRIETVKSALSIWKRIGNTIASSSDNLLVPISGGLDSRLILSSIRQASSNREISTFTFGPRGSFDYEYGALVAKHYETKHVSYDLSDYNLSQHIIDNRRFIKNPTNILYMPPLCVINRDFPPDKFTMISGFMGDPSVGSHYPHRHGSDGLNYVFSKETTDGVNPASVSGFENFENTLRGYMRSSQLESALDIEKWDIANRQAFGVLPKVQYAHYAYKFPFLDSAWLRLCSGLTISELRGLKFYNAFLAEFDRPGFTLPTKNYLGAGVPSILTQNLKWRYGQVNRKISIRKYRRLGANYFDTDDLHWQIWQDNKTAAVEKISTLPLITNRDIDGLLKANRQEFSSYVNLIGLGLGA
jgi:hypothetical protein